MTTLKDEIIAILNEDLSPWVFDGSEPMAKRIIGVCEGALLELVSAKLMLNVENDADLVTVLCEHIDKARGQRNGLDFCSCGHRREGHHAWGKCHAIGCKCTDFVLSSFGQQRDSDLAFRALRLAKEATNGWACYAKRQAEHDNIAHLHREIAALERYATTKGDATGHAVDADAQ